MLKTKIKHYFSFSRVSALAVLALLIVLSFNRSLSAQQTFTQGYGSDGVIQKGMIVKLKKSDTSKVELVTSDTAADMHGVVVNPTDSAFTLAAEGQRTYVATGGSFEVLVSTQNGPVKPGDYITASAIDGVGMKATSREAVVVGKALAEFNGKDGVISTTEVKDSKGATIKVSLGYVMTDISVTRNPLLKAKEPNLPSFLKKAVETVAGKTVSATKAYIAVFVFALTCIVSGSLMYSGVRSGIISLGRNPLSKKSIIRGMMQVIIVALIVFVIGIFGVYLLLKL